MTADVRQCLPARGACLVRAASIFFAGMLAAAVVPASSASAQEERPNVVLIFTDDLGYQDVGCYGAQGFQTPHLDRMAAEGVRFTDFYVAQAVCGASRAALLTGCYPNRIGLLGAPGPNATHGIHDRELTLAEMLKSEGYATAMYGKWHLGHHKQFLPPRHGFDDYFGLPYSNDMWPKHPTGGKSYPDLPLIENLRTVAYNPDQSQLTTWYAERAVKFIEQHRDQPFFLYVAHAMPHVPLFVSDKQRGKSQQGLYGDVIQEIDWSVGEILAALQKHGLDERTLLIFTSDNGPWLSYGNHAGSAGPLREGKGTTWEGGMRVPCLMRWPGKIPPGIVCDEVAATIDVLPTLAARVGARLPEHPIDGKDIWPLMSGQAGAKAPHQVYYYYWGEQLHAVRSGPWKLVFPHQFRSLTGTPGRDGQPGGYTQEPTEMALFNLKQDVGERNNVVEQHPEVVEQLNQLADQAREELGDSLTGRKGARTRPAAKL